MGIKIIDEPDIYLTKAEHNKLRNDYDEFMRGHYGYMSFEDYIRRAKILDNQNAQKGG